MRDGHAQVQVRISIYQNNIDTVLPVIVYYTYSHVYNSRLYLRIWNKQRSN